MMSSGHEHCPWCSTRWWNEGDRVFWHRPWDDEELLTRVIDPCVPVGQVEPGVELLINGTDNSVVVNGGSLRKVSA